eukprot:TRINITY_DN4703_c0_g1_i1.p1 TRINITY_DN4703_c0_g1~~TRINITY_DN4703_c0_g1_i1.p1  ORF type:complete len:60 (-),score=3.88 TRINITY_DN4703_c0_g1_i1:190-369(-)
MAIPRKICSLQTRTFMSKTKLSLMNTKLRHHAAEIFWKFFPLESIVLVLSAVQFLYQTY